MKKISFWAKNHKPAARLIIIISFIALTLTGLFTGIILYNLGIPLSYQTFLFFVLMYVTGVISYPVKYKKQEKIKARNFYTRQKTCDVLLATATFCMLIYIAQYPETFFNKYESANASIIATTVLPEDSSIKTYKSVKEFSASQKDQNGNHLKWKARKKLLKEQVRLIKKSTELSKSAKVGLIILSVLVALGLIALVSSLACSLSCNGSEGAAVLVGIGGTALIIFLLVIAIRGITGKKKKKKSIEIQKPDISD